MARGLNPRRRPGSGPADHARRRQPPRRRPGARPPPPPPSAVAESRPRAPAVVADPTRIRLLTYNVLADPDHVGLRIPPLLELLGRADADVIALQEVAPWLLRALLAQPWTRRYQISRFEGRVQAPGGQLVASRFPIVRSLARVLPGRQQRTVVVSVLRVGDTEVAVATTHMESFLEDGPTRARQLDVIFELLRPFSHAVLLGDLNFGDGEQPETARLDRGYGDLWLALWPGEPGFTWDMERSEMARRGAFPNELSRRLDRILVRLPGWEPESVRILGDMPVPGSRGKVHPSDHFGLMGTLRRSPRRSRPEARGRD